MFMSGVHHSIWEWEMLNFVWTWLSHLFFVFFFFFFIWFHSKTSSFVRFSLRDDVINAHQQTSNPISWSWRIYDFLAITSLFGGKILSMLRYFDIFFNSFFLCVWNFEISIWLNLRKHRKKKTKCFVWWLQAFSITKFYSHNHYANN